MSLCTWCSPQLFTIVHLFTPHSSKNEFNPLSPPEEIKYLKITKHCIRSKNLRGEREGEKKKGGGGGRKREREIEIKRIKSHYKNTCTLTVLIGPSTL